MTIRICQTVAPFINITSESACVRGRYKFNLFVKLNVALSIIPSASFDHLSNVKICKRPQRVFSLRLLIRTAFNPRERRNQKTRMKALVEGIKACLSSEGSFRMEFALGCSQIEDDLISENSKASGGNYSCSVDMKHSLISRWQFYFHDLNIDVV